ncbi:MAG: type III polyketide synthase [Lentisphaerae bacterium]|jgi:predicted naringenin-chalcone synthase|nr:type III polyketide synthase [Lentisphaerota bacterium]MBT4816347.1 type III polyketide synthase [Lentisphaerota bacterium]MBT5609878.1 type III polyketide synthase [Lentisphaerota bacterium]MBT7056924.1 type III polyketide synthase [Lentisphaerota bacterium]MBT7847074.1 type III polyketide synthase [Lentisphaerota bacterium]
MTPLSVNLRSLATANPPLYVTQEEAFAHYDRLFDLTQGERDLYQRLLLDSAIRGRYVGMDSPDEAAQTDQDRLVERFLKFARSTAADAVRGALRQAGLAADDIGGIAVNSCTGYLCPGLTSYIAEDVGLPTHMMICDLVGMGCGGALPNLEVAAGMLLRRPEKPVLSVAVEICTATLFMGEDPALVVSNSIFGDGASAAVLETASKAATDTPKACILDFESGLFPAFRSHLHYRTEAHRLRNVLGIRVPVIGAKTARNVAERLLTRHGLTFRDIAHWAVHPGGTAVLDRVEHTLELPPETLRQSRAVFEQYGNMSSPSVMFVLDRILTHECPKQGELGLMLAFGAGFSTFAALLRF